MGMKWRNCNKGNLDDLASLVCNLPFKDKDMRDSEISKIKTYISEWGITEEGRGRVEAVMEEARKEKEKERITEDIKTGFRNRRMGFNTDDTDTDTDTDTDDTDD